MTFYNEEMVAQKYSVILTNWKRGRENTRATKVSNATDSLLVKSGDNSSILKLFNLGNSVSVSPENAQRLSAIGACIGLLGDSMSTLPLHHFKKTTEGRARVEGSIIEKLFNATPSQNWTSASMIQWWVRCNILRGDAITEIIRDRTGNPIALIPYHPDRVEWKLINGDLIYRFSPLTGNPYNRSSDDVLHIPGNGFDGEKSMSAISYDANNSIGLGLAINQYGKKFFENGASPKHLFETESDMDVEQIDRFRDVYDSRYSGPANAGRPMILTEGLKLRELSMTSVDAQLLETLKYTVIDIARACRVPPVLIGAQETTSSWGSGVAEIKQGFVTFNLEPKSNLWAQEIQRKLIRNDTEFVEHDFKGFLRGDTKSEFEALRQSIGGSNGPGWLTINEARKVVNMPPVDGGDTLYIPKGATNEQKTSTAN